MGQHAVCPAMSPPYYCDGEWSINTLLLCGTLVEKRQDDYKGTINVTKSGKQCQHWDSLEPHNNHDKNLPAQSKGICQVLKPIIAVTLMVNQQLGATQLTTILDGSFVMFPSVRWSFTMELTC
jgi:hypothetical protein